MSKRNPTHRPTAGLKPATECIPLGALVERARSLDTLDGRLRSVLPAVVAAETRLGDIRNGRLVFLASSPTWAARLRLSQAALLAEARAALGDAVERFAVKVAPLPPVPPEPTRPKPLSAATARHLRAKATALSDPELRALYLNLASIADES